MLSRRLILAAAPVAKNALNLDAPVTTAVLRRLAHHGPPADYKHPTMDEMHVPCGSWKENYENYQRKYNIQLLFGVGFFTITIIACTYAGNFDFLMLTPDEPAPRQ